MSEGRGLSKRSLLPGDRPPEFTPDSDRVALRVQVLGGFHVRVGARAIPGDAWRRKAAAPVKLLALAPAGQLHREQVLESFWPAFSPAAAANNLHRTLHVARRTLEPDRAPGTPGRFLRLRGDILELAPAGELHVDANAFAVTAAAAQRTQDPAAYENALGHYTGDLLPEDRYEDWTAQRRDELRGLYLDLLAALARLHENRWEYPAAIATLHRLVAAEPAHEDAHLALMRLYAMTGQRHHALRQYEQLREALRYELDAEPASSSERLYRAIAADELSPLVVGTPAAGYGTATDDGLGSRGHPSLDGQPDADAPNPSSSFIGRERELAEVGRLLVTTRLLTLTGAGGCGKTRLALATVERLRSHYADGAWLVELAAIADPALVAGAVAAALGVREEPGRPLEETLTRALGDRQLLLLLDNCEHLGAGCVRLVELLLRNCPALRILATSRMPLNAPGELAWRVPSLTLPKIGQAPPPAEVGRFDAVRLFVARAGASRAGFALTGQNAAAVLEICRRLDGMPLALELAAARVKVLAPQQIAPRLDDALGLLAGGDRAAATRQQTLRATLDWSYALLTEPERRAFRRLAVFAGGWTPEAAEAVCPAEGAGEMAAGDVLDLLAQLVDQSLIVMEERDGQMRGRLLEPVRQYAAEHLRIAGEEWQARDQHLAWCRALLEEATPALSGPEQDRWFARLAEEHDNLRAALGWTFERGDAATSLRLGFLLSAFWSRRGYRVEGLRWLERALASGGAAPAALRADALHAAGCLTVDTARALALFEESLALARELGDQSGIARNLNCLGLVWWTRADYQRAATLFEETLALRRVARDTGGTAGALHNLGVTRLYQGQHERALELQRESLDLYRELGNQQGIAVVLHALALVALERRDYDEAETLLRESLGLCRTLGYQVYIAHCLWALAEVAAGRERWVRVARLTGAAESLYDTIGVFAPLNERDRHEAALAAARAHLPAEAFAAAWAAGRALSPAKAVAEALGVEDAAGPLTRREREVARLLAGRLTNRQIAAELGISERTAETHVNNTLHKLGLASRDQVAAWPLAQDHPPAPPDKGEPLATPGSPTRWGARRGSRPDGVRSRTT